LVGPFVPDRYALLLQPPDIAVATQEPKQFENDRFDMKLLGCEQRKALAEVEAQLTSEHSSGARSSSIASQRSSSKDVLKQFGILVISWRQRLDWFCGPRAHL
jgi:hypothetical protein